MKLLLATRNQGKIKEIEAIIDEGFSFVTLQDFVQSGDFEEYGDTIEENALIKAKTAYDKSSITSLADDSGLFVEILDGRPGPVSARYASDDETRIKRLLGELAGKSERRAVFRCAIAVVGPIGEKIFIGECEGSIALQPAGNAGFGYDPIFIPKGYEKTFAELGEKIKNGISHRTRALLKAKEYLLSLIK